ncbi:MAG TPA: hypothetical protein VKM55_01030 [Candidatus Lokiarchaeia archaeon]|nr:hypothetical protein [Candidatus Lokiarchaeia archaeon]
MDHHTMDFTPRHEEKIMTSYQRAKQFKLSRTLTRKIDLDTLVLAGVGALENSSMLRFIYGDVAGEPIEVAAVLSLRYPDPELCSTGSDKESLADVMLFREHILKAWLAMEKKFSLYFTRYMPDEYYAATSSWSTSSEEQAGGFAEARLKVTVLLLDGDAPGVVKDILLRAIDNKAFQYARSARLQISYRASVAKDQGWCKIDGDVFCNDAPIVDVPVYLQADKMPEIREYFSHPAVAAAIADACRGYRVTCDEALWGSEPAKRCNVDGVKIRIDDQETVTELASGYQFCAFYPGARLDEHLGRLLDDIDVQPGFVHAIGKQGAWAATCGVSDAIVEAATGVGFPVPGRHSSGNRSIHVFWNVADDALAVVDGVVDVPPYVVAILLADDHLGAVKTTSKWLSDPGFVARKMLEAIVVRAIYTVLIKNPVLSPAQRRLLRIESDSQLVTLSKEEDPDAFSRIAIDAQPSCYRWFSPHFKTGWVARSIVDASGVITPRYRDLNAIATDFTMKATLAALDAGGTNMDDTPGLVTRDTLCNAAALLGGELRAITVKGEKDVGSMDLAEYWQFVEDHASAVGRALDRSRVGVKFPTRSIP